MKTRQTIVIIGVGTMGAALAMALAPGNYRLLLHAQSHPAVENVAAAVYRRHPGADIEVAACAADASWEADIVILDIPADAEAGVAAHIRELANRKVVVAIAQLRNADPPGLPAEASDALQNMLPHAFVVRAYCHLNDSDGIVFSGDATLTGSDTPALQAASELFSAAGFTTRLAGISGSAFRFSAG